MLTVLQDSNLRNFTTLAAAKVALGVTGTSDDTTINALIDRASGIIADYCGWTFAPARYQQKFRPETNRDRRNLLLARRPVITNSAEVPGGMSIAVSVSVDGTALVQDTDFEIESGCVLWRLSGDTRIPWSGTAVSATWTAGFGMPTDENTYTVTLPRGVSETCLDLVAAAYAGIGRDAAVQSESAEGVGRTTYFDRGTESLGLTADMMTRLNRFAVRP